MLLCHFEAVINVATVPRERSSQLRAGNTGQSAASSLIYGAFKSIPAGNFVAAFGYLSEALRCAALSSPQIAIYTRLRGPRAARETSTQNHYGFGIAYKRPVSEAN
ncbi:unnamed protein product, partial [Iphiclides podalirius]